MKRITFTCILSIFFIAITAQEITITFQSENQNKVIDSIWVTNLSTSEQVKLLANDTLLLAESTQTDDFLNPLDLVYPNPCNGSAQLFLKTNSTDKVRIKIYSITGQIISTYNQPFNIGNNVYNLKFPRNGLYMISAQINEKITCWKVVNLGEIQQEPNIEIAGTFNLNNLKSGMEIKTLGYSPTDIIHYLVFSEDNQTVFTDSPSISKNYKVEFYDCLRAGSKNYKTVKIGEQIWMAENLAYLPHVNDWKSGSNSDPCYYVGGYNGTDVSEAKEKQYYIKYGVLYNLPAALKVCPDGWHLPSDLEWNQLAQYISDQKGPFQKTDTYWYDVGNFLKASSGWSYNGNGTDDFGFSALPGGERTSGGNPVTGEFSNFWSSTAYFGTTTYFWYMGGSYTWIKRTTGMNDQGFNVRCIQNPE